MNNKTKRVFSVSQINSYIRRIFDSDYALRSVYLKGEVSNCKYHSQGHIYFTLKDATSAIRCVMFSSDKSRGLSFRLADGQSVIVGGNITVFERDGAYQMYARNIELSGAGELYLRYEQLKRELAEKGYFDFEHKKPLPAFPEKIGIVTALTGAAIEDIKSVAMRRNPYVQLYLYPAKVQGLGAAKTIADGIRYFDRQDMDIIIIGRGGGSIEDLWAFNELEVADAIFHAVTPIISGTGHEIDMTIADYCADVRAATPSAACEIAIPDIYGILQQFDRYKDELDYLLQRKLQHTKEALYQYQRMLEGYRPEKKLIEEKMRYERLYHQLHQEMADKISSYRHAYQLYLEKLEALSPTARLKGGYVFAEHTSGKPITKASELVPDQRIRLTFADGKVDTVVQSVELEHTGVDHGKE